tara:strand:- start:3819 stop:5153 length:1335 start_codon:yes stop_codon:yes gene_type:complete
MKKIKEINLNPSYDLGDYPSNPRYGSSNGGPRMSADSGYSRLTMQRVNKGMQEEEEEEEEMPEDETKNLLKEFAPFDMLSGTIKSGAMSIPIFGDLFAFGKFTYTVYNMRRLTRSFTSRLSKLSGVELGNDFLEPEGKISDQETLRNNLIEATNRIRNLNDYPELDVNFVDIKKLKSEYVILCKYVKDAIMEFVGFADVAFGQQGFYLNVGLSAVTFSTLPDFIVGEYSQMISKMKLRAEAEEGMSLKNLLRGTASMFLKVPQKILDFTGNTDLLINPEKLSNLTLVHNMFKVYKDVDTNEEKAEMGLDAIPGTPFDEFLKKNYADYSPEAYKKYADLAKSAKEIQKIASDLDLKSLTNEIFDLTLNKKYSLYEVYKDMKDEDIDEYDEDSLEEFSSGGVGGAPLPLGMKVGNSAQNGGKASIYTATDARKFQDFAKKTMGNKK